MVEWETVKIPKPLLRSVEKIIDSEHGRSVGLQNKNQFVTDAVKKMVREYDERLKHINMYDDHVKILDNDLERRGRIVSIYFKGGSSPWCDYCEEASCIHVQFAWEMPDVKRALSEKGMRPPAAKGGERAVP